MRYHYLDNIRWVTVLLAMFPLTPALYLLVRRIPVVRYCVLEVSRKSAK